MCWRSRGLQTANRWWILRVHHIGNLLHRHPQVFRSLRRDGCQTDSSRHSTTSARMGRDEKNRRRNQQRLSLPRHGSPMLPKRRPPKPTGSAAVSRVLSVQHGHILNYVERRVFVTCVVLTV